MNLNKGCIEMNIRTELTNGALKMNLNKGCIEINEMDIYIFKIG